MVFCLPRWMLLPAVLGTVLSVFSRSAAADEDGEKPAALPSKVEVSGVLEAVRSHEIANDSEHLGSLEIKRLVAHGSEVSKGQTLIWFETEAVDKKIKDAETALQLSRLSLEAAEFAHKQALATEEIERGKAERDLANARQAFDNFMNVDREREIASAEFSVKRARVSLENATEELEQLKQMYDEDDLTEESEEIVLKRAQHGVENAQFRLEGVEITSGRAISQVIPASVAAQEDTLSLAEIAHEKGDCANWPLAAESGKLNSAAPATPSRRRRKNWPSSSKSGGPPCSPPRATALRCMARSHVVGSATSPASLPRALQWPPTWW